MTDGSEFLTRQARLGKEMMYDSLDALVLNPGPSLTYLTGLHFHLMERPTVAIFVPGKPLFLILPELESAKAASVPYPIEFFTFGENPGTWQAAFSASAQRAGLNGLRIGVEPRSLRVLELRYLEGAVEKAQFLSGEKTLAALRMKKDSVEIDLLRKAVGIAQRALVATLPFVEIGMTERDLATELVLQLLRAGADPDLPFSPIVSAGPNTANPHATPSDRELQEGDLLLFDWGCGFDGYISDLTRTFVLGKPPAEFEKIAKIVAEANSAGRAAGKPGLAAGEIDRAARQVIEAAGYGEAFFHRTGHGIGREGHEEPYLFGDNQLILEKGMVYTVEPGIYLRGRGGIRIEDDMVITAEGAESLSDLPRDLIQIA